MHGHVVFIYSGDAFLVHLLCAPVSVLQAGDGVPALEGDRLQGVVVVLGAVGAAAADLKEGAKSFRKTYLRSS